MLDSRTFTLDVNRKQSFQSMIQAGSYDGVNQFVTQEHFPVRDKKTMEQVTVGYIFFDPEHEATTQEVIEETIHHGGSHARIEVLLAHGATYKKEQTRHPIAGLGTIWNLNDGSGKDGRFVPVLYAENQKRILGPSFYERKWRPKSHFLIVLSNDRQGKI